MILPVPGNFRALDRAALSLLDRRGAAVLYAPTAARAVVVQIGPEGVDVSRTFPARAVQRWVTRGWLTGQPLAGAEAFRYEITPAGRARLAALTRGR